MLLTLAFSSALLLAAVLVAWRQLQPRLQSLAGFQAIPSPTRYAVSCARCSALNSTSLISLCGRADLVGCVCMSVSHPCFGAMRLGRTAADYEHTMLQA